MITYLYSLDRWWRQEGRSATWQCHNVIKNGEQHDQHDQLCSWQKPFVWSSRIPCSSMSSDLQTGSDLNISWSTVVDRPIHCKYSECTSPVTMKTTQSNSYKLSISTRYWRSLIWRSMPMGPNVIQHMSNDGLEINEQNRISQWCNLQRTHCKRIGLK